MVKSYPTIDALKLSVISNEGLVGYTCQHFVKFVLRSPSRKVVHPIILIKFLRECIPHFTYKVIDHRLGIRVEVGVDVQSSQSVREIGINDSVACLPSLLRFPLTISNSLEVEVRFEKVSSCVVRVSENVSPSEVICNDPGRSRSNDTAEISIISGVLNDDFVIFCDRNFGILEDSTNDGQPTNLS